VTVPNPLNLFRDTTLYVPAGGSVEEQKTIDMMSYSGRNTAECNTVSVEDRKSAASHAQRFFKERHTVSMPGGDRRRESRTKLLSAEGGLYWASV